MKMAWLFVLTVLFSCASGKHSNLAKVHIVDRNGFVDIIQNKDRLKHYQGVDFLKPQPFEKVTRTFELEKNDKPSGIITTYYPNGQIKQYLELKEGRAHGVYKEWFENGSLKLQATVLGGASDITNPQDWVFDGVSTAFNESGSLIAQIPYCKGFLCDISLYYHPNGSLHKKVPYVQGLVDGVEEVYLSTLELLCQTHYKQGKRHGPSVRYWTKDIIAAQEDYEDDVLLKGAYFYPNGTLFSSVKDRAGKKAIFGQQSIIGTQEIHQGRVEGRLEDLDLQGRLTRSFEMKNGKMHGVELVFFESGQEKLSISWVDGRIHGPMKTWYENSQLESVRDYKDNKKQGTSTSWYRNGALMFIEEYDDDRLIRGNYYKKSSHNTSVTPLSSVIDGTGAAHIFDGDGILLKIIRYENGNPI